VTIPESMNLEQIIDTFKTHNAPYLHVLNQDQELTGIISFRDIRPILHEESVLQLIIAKDIASTSLVTTTPDETLQQALEKITSAGVSQLPVVEDGKLIGTLRECDVTATYSQELIKRELERT
jgi:CIC family chloride channel protein